MSTSANVGSRRTADDKWDDFFKHDGGKIGGKVDFYSENAAEFDKATGQPDVYNGAKHLANSIHENFKDKQDASLIFICAGTGFEIAELQKLGSYTNLTALDAAEGMLDILKSKNVCHNFIQSWFHLNSGLPHNSYDGVCCTGGFVPKHLQIDALEEMCNICKPGGLVIITMREAYLYESEDYNENKFFNQVDRLAQEQKWEKLCVERVDDFYSGLSGMKFIMRKL